MNMSRKYFLIALIALIVLGLLGTVSCGRLKQIKGSISGTVYMDGRPVSGTIILKDANGATIAQERTNTGGHYRITDLEPGTYIVQYLNYQGVPWAKTQTVEVRIGRPEIVDLQLSATDRAAIGGN